MIEVTKQYRTETGHRLMDYDGRCSHYHGHSYLWEVTAILYKMDNALKSNGMVIDFSDLKAAMSFVLDPLDHAMVLFSGDPSVEIMKDLKATNGKNPRVLVFDWNPTAENFAKYAGENIQKFMWEIDNSIRIKEVKVWETATSYATWRA